MTPFVRFSVIGTIMFFALQLIGTKPVKGAPGGTQYTLTSGTDFTPVNAPGHPVGCPQACSTLYAITNPIYSPPGTVITSIQVASRTQHTPWHRCQVEIACGVEEFSDVNDHHRSCIGTRGCGVWRAWQAQGSQPGSEQDVINVTWQ